MPSLTLAEARARAAQLSDVAYDLEIDLTDEQTFGSRVTVRFASNQADTFLELHRGQDVRVTVNGTPVEAAYDGARIALTGLLTGPADRNEVVVAARLPYVTDGDGMHAFTDPADGERYVSAYVGVDVRSETSPAWPARRSMLDASSAAMNTSDSSVSRYEGRMNGAAAATATAMATVRPLPWRPLMSIARTGPRAARPG